MMKQEERVAHLPKRWATSSRSCRDAGIPSVFPAKAGIHVASPGLYARELAYRHTLWRDVFGGVNGFHQPQKLPYGWSQTCCL